MEFNANNIRKIGKTPIEILRLDIKTSMEKIPDFIDTRVLESKYIWTNLSEVFGYFYNLTREKVILPTGIKNIHTSVTLRINFILDIVFDTDVEIMISQLILTALDRYIAYSESEELYEVCHNMTEFKKLYMESYQ